MTIRQKRIFFILLLFFSTIIVTTLIILALKENINFFLKPAELMTQAAKFKDKPNLKLRVGGMVKKGSLHRNEDLWVNFKITDFNKDLDVKYQGILPDLFKEGQGVVVLGKLLQDGSFAAEEILAKHDENYMPPQN